MHICSKNINVFENTLATTVNQLSLTSSDVTNDAFEQQDPSYLWQIRYTWTVITLRKHAYSNMLKISPPKNEKFQIKNSNIFHISA